jgi:hypothetical protein
MDPGSPGRKLPLFRLMSGSIRGSQKKYFSLFLMLYLDLKEIFNFDPAKCDF